MALEYDISCIIWKDNISFSRKFDLFFSMENDKRSFSKKYVEIQYFLQMSRKDGLS